MHKFLKDMEQSGDLLLFKQKQMHLNEGPTFFGKSLTERCCGTNSFLTVRYSFFTLEIRQAYDVENVKKSFTPVRWELRFEGGHEIDWGMAETVVDAIEDAESALRKRVKEFVDIVTLSKNVSND